MLNIPPHLDDWYPNAPRDCFGTPAVLFRDHRLTLPLIDLAAREGLLELPVTLVSFDRHRDALAPLNGADSLAGHRTSNGGQVALAGLVAHHLSSRDDDWIPAGMELGLIGDVVQFSSNPDFKGEDPVAIYTDAGGDQHRMYRLGRPVCELSFKGAFTDTAHPAAIDGLWETVGWQQGSAPAHTSAKNIVCDIDLDYWTIAWETHTFPYPRVVFEAEWLAPAQSDSELSMCAADLMHRFIKDSVLLTIASEPYYCGCAANATIILNMIDKPLFGGVFSGDSLLTDYPPSYPST